ncbi:5-formyltetrahydrofolate cyclo-ligase [Shimazuella sp. AN120528]|uniref:5-formyltetrahydrofolate cyclo-ligase n=1 Tax=Shimazuella soli TaxID=1892854 RepID=UPI001F0EF119|nr:5-formyltetrahydrofolate cyclo-ligase [Shimazuella soli]MCH5585407.1 5-formyltetrahydrofolate cyclo-ligase [Shimazuella soli]
MKKQTIRKDMIALRTKMSSPDRIQASRKICEKIKQLPIYQEATSILAYFAVRNEVSLYPLFEDAWRSGKRVSLPSMEQDKIVPRLFTTPSALETGDFHIMEPDKSCEKIDITKLDLVLVPGVAFDRKGYRLGFGKGHYDRFFEKLPDVYKCGIAYDEQIVETIYPEVHDIPMDFVLTPNKEI